MKIKDVSKISENDGLTVLRENLQVIVELPCLEACLDLYGKNIRTIESNGNLEGSEKSSGIATIMIDYDCLSNQNKEIVRELCEKKIIDGITADRGRYKTYIFTIDVPMSRESDVFDISEQFKKISSFFVEQDVLYGNRTLEQVHNDYKASYGLDLSFDELISCELELGKVYDEKEQRIWDNEELLQKHIQFINKYGRGK